MPMEEHATIKDAFAEYDAGQGSTSESPTLNTLISDAKLVSDDHYCAQGGRLECLIQRTDLLRQSSPPVCQQEL